MRPRDRSEEGGREGRREGWGGGPPESPPGAVKGRWEMGKGEDPEANLGLLPHHSSASVTLSEEWAGLGTFISLTRRGGYIYF